MLQPHQVMTIQSKNSNYSAMTTVGYLIALRLKPSVIAKDNLEGSAINEKAEMELLNQEDSLATFIEQNFSIFERLRGKKRSLINQTVQKLMKKFGEVLSRLVVDEITQMVIDDLELMTNPDELSLKC